MAQLEGPPHAYRPLIRAVQVMFETPKFSDLTIQCGDQQWRTHQNIVLEAQDKVITLREDGPDVVAAMVRFFYYFDYSDAYDKTDPDSPPPMIFNVHVHIIADKYDIPELAKLAARKFADLADSEWQSPDFADAASLVFTTAAHALYKLRDIIIDVASKHAEALSKHEYGARFLAAASAVPALVSALWLKQVEAAALNMAKWPAHILKPCPSTYQCFRTRPRELPSTRQFHASARHETTLLRRNMYDWLKGPGKAFRKPLGGSTNYLSAYDKFGNLHRSKVRRRDQRTDIDEGKGNDVEEDEESAAQRDMEDQSLTDDDRAIRAEQREMAREARKAENEEAEERGGVPRERMSDMRPYPLNQQFRSQPVLSEALREQLYIQVAVEERDLSSVAASFGVDLRRVAAVVRLKTIEKQWEEEGKTLAKSYSDAVLSMLPTTPFKPDTKKAITPHEPINDLPVHPHTRQQIFYPASESRQFTREDAAKVFSAKLLPADQRIPLPMLVDLEKWKLEGLDRQQRQARQRIEWEARTQRVVKGRRWDFQFQDISAEKVGRDGRGREAVGYRYGMPHMDRKRGIVKIPTSVA
ncbi:hypothetical protein B0A55_09258 [Friedmanniomyces simplex]|uniref:BTB domain-containing protein n=1 Tax=Friedmanniomyces simplex TaxID=329884 RepID=A0A4U0X0B1_9PEZI|nr:hypothetical protein B0A55_09258 [Friedmanniomyces simplex]